jgi:ferredoxin
MDVPPSSRESPPAPESSTASESTAEAAPRYHTVTVHTGDGTHEISVRHGTTLLDALRRNDLSPFNALTQIANCGGQGHCGACSVEVVDGSPASGGLLDGVLNGLDAGRLACAILVDRDMTVRL